MKELAVAATISSRAEIRIWAVPMRRFFVSWQLSGKKLIVTAHQADSLLVLLQQSKQAYRLHARELRCVAACLLTSLSKEVCRHLGQVANQSSGRAHMTPEVCEARANRKNKLSWLPSARERHRPRHHQLLCPERWLREEKNSNRVALAQMGRVQHARAQLLLQALAAPPRLLHHREQPGVLSQ